MEAHAEPVIQVPVLPPALRPTQYVNNPPDPSSPLMQSPAVSPTLPFAPPPPPPERAPTPVLQYEHDTDVPQQVVPTALQPSAPSLIVDTNPNPSSAFVQKAHRQYRSDPAQHKRSRQHRHYEQQQDNVIPVLPVCHMCTSNRSSFFNW